MSCKIVFKPNNKVEVKQYPELFENLIAYSNEDMNVALEMYGYAIDEKFKPKDKEYPSLKELLLFINESNIDSKNKITAKDRLRLQELLLTTNKVENPTDKFIQSFTVEGMFGISRESLEDAGLFSSSDISIIESMENVDEIRELYYKVVSNDIELSQVETDFKITDGNLERTNPDVYLQHVYEEYMGLKTVAEVITKAELINDQTVIDNTEMAEQILNHVKGKEAYRTLESDEYSGMLEKKQVNGTVTRLEQTISLTEDVQPLIEQIDVVMNLSIVDFVQDLESVDKYVKNIELQMINVGIDVTNLSEKMQEKTYDEVMEYFGALRNLLEDINNQDGDSIIDSIEEYAEVHDLFFDVELQLRKTVTDDIGSTTAHVVIDTNLSDYQVFTQFNLLRVKDNFYTDFYSKDTYENLLKRIDDSRIGAGKTKYKINEEIESIAREYIEPQNFDFNEAKRMVALKMISGYNTAVNAEPIEYVVNNGFNPYKFVVEFNKKMIKDKAINEMFYISQRGIEAKVPLGEYSIELLKNKLSEKGFNDLVNYSIVSQNKSLEGLQNLSETIVKPDIDTKRLMYVNNPNRLLEYKGLYTQTSDAVVTDKFADEFIKIKGVVFERVEGNIYGRIEAERGRYKITQKIEKPTVDIDEAKKQIQDIKTETKINNRKIDDNNIEFC